MLAETQGGQVKIKYAQDFGSCSHFDKGDKDPHMKYCIQYIEQREIIRTMKNSNREKKKAAKLNSAEIILLKN